MDALWLTLRILTTIVCLFFIVGHILNMSRHPHWFVRGWDFPRPQTAVMVLALGALYAWLAWPVQWYDALLLGGLLWSFVYQVCKILPYTFLWRCQVRSALTSSKENRVRLLICNVMMDNDRYEDMLKVVRREDPDIALFAEVNQAWVDHLNGLDYPYKKAQPQDNCYGMMLLSRIPIKYSKFRFLIEDDIPSMRATLELPNGRKAIFFGLHPRPPEPIRDQDADERDAELILVGREIRDLEEKDLPIIVAGDLNDVAWSNSNSLFLRISQMLDPRIGRGRFSTWNADSYIWRVPLDHIFHSADFELIDMRVLEHVGSDHFPIVVDLYYHPRADQEEDKPKADGEDEKIADEKVREGRGF